MKRTLFTLTAAVLMTSGLAFAQPRFTPTTGQPAGRIGNFSERNTVNARQVEQQRRIAQGVGSGQLTPRETARLENREARVHREIRSERAANGGYLTGAERRQVNRQQDRMSNSIYRDKHNDAQDQFARRHRSSY